MEKVTESHFLGDYYLPIKQTKKSYAVEVPEPYFLGEEDNLTVNVAGEDRLEWVANGPRGKLTHVAGVVSLVRRELDGVREKGSKICTTQKQAAGAAAQ